MEIPYEKRFHFRDGSAAGTLDELKHRIEGMSYQEFYHHVNASKNDFASWVQHVLKEERLADDLRKVTSIVETVEIINDFAHPRPVTAPRTDAQSRIEQAVLSTPLPGDTQETVVIEPQPTAKNPTLDFRIIEEKANLADPRVEARVKEELFGRQTTSQPEQLPPPKQPEPKVIEHLDAENTRMIVKDFIYGLVFGLLIGLILGKIIS